MEDCKDTAGLVHEVLEHDLRGEVHIDIMRSLDAADELIPVVESLRLAVRDQGLDLGELGTRGHSVKDRLRDHRICRELLLMGLDEALLQIEDLEAVTTLREEQELRLRHDLSEFSIAARILEFLIIIRKLHLPELFGVCVSDIDLIRPIRHAVLVGADVFPHLLQELSVRIHDSFRGDGRSVVEHQSRRIAETVTASLDYTVHVHTSFE